MRVRCLHCHTDHRYAPDLISHRKATAPSESFKEDRPSFDAGDGDRETSPDQQEDRGVGDSGGRVILDREIAPLSSSLRRDKIVIAAVSGKRSTIFVLSSCLFAAGSVSQLALDIVYPVPLAVLNELRSSGVAMLLGTACFGAVLLGLALFTLGMGSLFVEPWGFKRKVEGCAKNRLLKISGRQNSCTSDRASSKRPQRLKGTRLRSSYGPKRRNLTKYLASNGRLTISSESLFLNGSSRSESRRCSAAVAVRKARSGRKQKQLGCWSAYGCLMRILDGCGLRFEWPGN
jgi:hypothetical protein